MKKLIAILIAAVALSSCLCEEDSNKYYYKLEIHYTNGDKETFEHYSNYNELNQWILKNGSMCIYEGHNRKYIVCDVRRWKILEKKTITPKNPEFKNIKP